MTLDQFMQRFEKRTKTANGFMVRCPGHEDKEASLSVGQGKDGAILLKCHAGCETSAICATMGLTLKDLFAEPLPKPVSLGYANEKREIVKTYSYTDALGRELFQVVRMVPKTFRQKHSDGKGGWIWSMENVERVLYRLPEVLAAKEVWVCFSPDTELLTPMGWVKIEDRPKIVAQYQPVGAEVSFVEPTDRQVFNFDGSAILFENSFCNLLVTPDHRMLVNRGGLNRLSVIKASEVMGQHRIPTAGIMQGDVAISVNQARLIAAFQADGMITNRHRNKIGDPSAWHHPAWNLKKERKKARLRKLLTDCQVEWQESSYRSCPEWTLFTVQRKEMEWVLHWLDDDAFLWSTLNWPLDARIGFLEELGHWDGDFSGRRGVRFFTSSEQSANVVCAVAACSGWSVGMRVQRRTYRKCMPEYIVNLVRNTRWRQGMHGKNPKPIPYSGPVHCVTVPSGFLIVRRNGKVCVAGNCEGERDVDSLVALGFCATCNVGGAGKWLDGYTESLAGKDVILCGDNDEPGRKHIEMVFDSLAPRAKTVRIIKLPSSFKDVTDFIYPFVTTDAATKELKELAAAAIPHMGGIKMPVYSMAEIEPRYREQVLNSDAVKLDLSKWLPSLRRVRPLVAGELALFIGNTGAGKTALLQNIAVNAKHLRTVMFEMELPEELLFERFVALKKRITCREVEDSYRVSEEGADAMNIQFPNLCICTEPKQTLESLEAIINRAELKMGGKPSLVLIDYVQLMQAKGSRYEKTSDVAEGLKIIAKSTKTIIVVASQVARPSIDTPKIGLHSGKDSGSLENSAGLVIGAWRDSTDESAMHVKVLKATKGGAGTELVCNFDGARMTITERINDPTDMFTKRP